MKFVSYQPFRKPNNDPKYVDINSNHPPQILKQIPNFISEKLSENSISKEVFDKSKMLYEKSLNKNGFNENLMYHQDNRSKNQNEKFKKHFKNCKNEHWSTVLRFDSLSFPDISKNIQNLS